MCGYFKGVSFEYGHDITGDGATSRGIHGAQFLYVCDLDQDTQRSGDAQHFEGHHHFCYVSKERSSIALSSVTSHLAPIMVGYSTPCRSVKQGD